MKKAIAILAVLAAFAASSTAYALYSVSNKGEWPATWPKELEPLRNQSRTFVGPQFDARHFAIRFTKREEFEAAWPQLLAVKTKGAPVFLMRGENFFLGDKTKAGVVVHCPPESWAKNPKMPEASIAGVENLRMRWMNTNYVELVVDGEVVDLNRIKLPDDCPVVDERFKKK